MKTWKSEQHKLVMNRGDEKIREKIIKIEDRAQRREGKGTHLVCNVPVPPRLPTSPAPSTAAAPSVQGAWDEGPPMDPLLPSWPRRRVWPGLRQARGQGSRPPSLCPGLSRSASHGPCPVPPAPGCQLGPSQPPRCSFLGSSQPGTRWSCLQRGGGRKDLPDSPVCVGFSRHGSS